MYKIKLNFGIIILMMLVGLATSCIQKKEAKSLLGPSMYIQYEGYSMNG